MVKIYVLILGGVIMLKKILVPVDGSDSSLRALEYAINLAKLTNAQLSIVEVVVPYDLTKLPKRKPKNEAEAKAMAKQEAATHVITNEEKATDILKKEGCTNYKYYNLISIDPADRILKAIEHLEPDTIVMGHRGMGTFFGVLMGSVAVKIAQGADCPVILVK